MHKHPSNPNAKAIWAKVKWSAFHATHWLVIKWDDNSITKEAI